MVDAINMGLGFKEPVVFAHDMNLLNRESSSSQSGGPALKDLH